MIRFIWLLLSLLGGGLIWVYMPRWPPSVMLMPIFASALSYMYGWLIYKRNWLIHFFSCSLWTGYWLAYECKIAWETQTKAFPFQIPSATVAKAIMIFSLIISGFLTFVNYRVSLNFVHRRGNIDKEQLVRLHPSTGEWKLFKRLFKKQEADIVLTLGKEIPFKD